MGKKDVFSNEYINDDSINKLKKLKDNSIDLILTDPPYNINFSNHFRRQNIEGIFGIKGIKNDKNNYSLLEEVYKEYFRVLKKGKHIYIFTRWDVQQNHINILEKIGFKVKNVLIWCKNNWSLGDLFGSYAGKYESIIFAYKYDETKEIKQMQLKEINGIRRHPDVLIFNRVSGKNMFHVHQKPIDLLQFLIKKSSDVGDIVLDGFAGSNSLGLAAASTLRKYITIELDKEIYKYSKEKSYKIIEELFENIKKVSFGYEEEIIMNNLNLIISNKHILFKEGYNITDTIKLGNGFFINYFKK